MDVEPHSTGTGPAFFTGVLHLAMVEHPGETSEILTRLARPVHSADDLLELLQSCVDVAVETIPAADHAGTTVQVGREAFTATHTDPLTLEVDRHQYEAGEGPCLHAARTGELTLVDVATSREEWPEFTADATSAGLTSFLAAPLGPVQPDGSHLGAINLYGAHHPLLTRADAVLLEVVADLVGQAVSAYSRLSSARDTARELRTALDSRTPIEQAKGMLMALHRIGPDAAFALLRVESQNSNRKLRDVAAELVQRLSTGAQRPRA